MRKKSRSGIIAWFVLLGIFLYTSITFLEQKKELDNIDREISILENRLMRERELNEDLQEQKESALTDENIEKIAREKLGMIKPGERVFVDAK